MILTDALDVRLHSSIFRSVMAALVEGVEYGLSSHSLHSANKSLFHVKLTDSALKAIEEFSSVKVCTLRNIPMRRYTETLL